MQIRVINIISPKAVGANLIVKFGLRHEAGNEQCRRTRTSAAIVTIWIIAVRCG
jgi:hypothetical protein